MAASPDDFLHHFVEEDDSPSQTAERIVELADGKRTVAEIARCLSEEFEGAPLAQVQADVAEFIRTLTERKVLVLHKRPVS